MKELDKLFCGMDDAQFLELLVADQVAEGAQTDLCIPGSLWYRVKRLLESPTAAIMTFWMQSTFSLQGVSLKAPSPLIVNTPLFSSHSMPSMVQLSSLSASAPL